jgi:putative transposase
MEFYKNSLYHIYNQGNNKEVIFNNRKDYLAFINKLRDYLMPNCDILAYCLMYNHFHILIQTNETSVEKIKIGNIELNKLTNSIRLILSEYALGFNKRNNRTGSLFRQKTKFKLVDNGNPYYPRQVFCYILRNPLESKIVKNLEDWEYSSFLDHNGSRKGTLCNLSLCKEILGFEKSDLDDIGSGVDDILFLKR